MVQLFFTKKNQLLNSEIAINSSANLGAGNVTKIEICTLEDNTPLLHCYVHISLSIQNEQ